MAAGLSSLGRGEDKMLVHMTPREVGGLRQLAMAAGGDLSINPHTGLPEAGFLSSLLPMVAGALLAPITAGTSLGLFGTSALVGGADAAITGSWKKGLMAGIGAYGGASLASGLGAAGVGANPAPAVVAGSGATPGVTSSLVDQATGLVATPGGAMTPDLAEASGYSTTTTTGATPGLTAQQAATQNAASKAAYNASLKAIAGQPEAWAHSYGQGLSNIGAGIGKLTTPGVFGGIGSTMGMGGVGSLGMGTLGAINASQPSGIPGKPQTPDEYYNTTYDPRTQTYSRGNWSTVYGGPGYTGTLGRNQVANNIGPLGSYSDPYTAVTATGNTGGSVKHLAEGGDPSSSSALSSYYNNLMSGKATTSNAPTSSSAIAANEAYMQGIGANTAPTQPIGSTSTTPWIYSGYLAETAPKTTTAGTTGTKAPGTGYAGMYGMRGMGDFGGIPSYTWDPATQSYKSTSGGMYSDLYNKAMQAAQGTTNTGGGVGGMGGMYGMGAGQMSGHAAGGGISSLNTFSAGGTSLGSYSDGGRLLKGPGDGMSDDIPAHITGDKPQPAALADGEFVIPADVVSHLGNGSTDAGSKTLYRMMDKVRRARTGNPKQGKQIDPNKFLPA
jgi:hypothetical protein